MQFPSEIEMLIKQFAQPRAATTHPDWREGSSIIWELVSDPWWYDFEVHGKAEDTWVDWCKDKMIIGPPRQRSNREEAELDEHYLTPEDIIRHYLPWYAVPVVSVQCSVPWPC